MAEDVNAGAAGAAQQSNQSGSTSAAAGVAANGSAAPWHANIDQSIKDLWAAKKYDISDPAKLVDVVSRNYQNAEKFMGVPPEELLRIPKPNADTTEINTFWNRVGVPKEAKDYDFSQVKMADGTDVDPAFLDTMRASLHGNRVPKEYAGNVVKDVVKYLEGKSTAEAAEITAEAQKQQQQLQTNWGNRAAYNMTVARDAMEAFGKLAGLTKEQTDQAVDALSKVGGIGAAPVLEMFRQIGARMGEAPFIGGGQRPAGDQIGTLSQQDAKAEIDALKRDGGFMQRYLSGDRDAVRKFTNLHQIAAGVVTVAA